jgi:putative endonuclease
VKIWYVYMIQSSRDQSTYTGITTDLLTRITAHNSGKGAKHTKARRPYKLLGYRVLEGRSFASKLEATVKRRSHDEKLALASVRTWQGPLVELINKILSQTT